MDILDLEVCIRRLRVVVAAFLSGAAILCLAGCRKKIDTEDRGPTAPESQAGLDAMSSQPGLPSGSDIAGDESNDQQQPVPARPPVPPPIQVEQYEAKRPKTALELQQFRETSSGSILDDAGVRGSATLTNLNPTINQWFLLELNWPDQTPVFYHLQNPLPSEQRVTLAPDFPYGLTLDRQERTQTCKLWSAKENSELLGASRTTSPYSELCQGRLLLRNHTSGRKTTLEWVTDFLRDHVSGGEKITVFVREKFFKDAFLATSELIDAEDAGIEGPARPQGAPATPDLDPEFEGQFLIPAELGLRLDTEDSTQLLAGRWYRVSGVPGVYLNAVQPRLVPPAVIDSTSRRLNPLDPIELSALVYLVGFDLDQLELGFMLGTDHPRVGWSDRVPASSIDPSLPGPDGIDTIEPLVRTGMVSPGVVLRSVSTFTGGFKRTHGAFKYSDLAVQNFGTHYGFIEHGAVLSKLQAGLATVIVFNDGTVDLKTWTDLDNADLWRIRHARQNGLPLVEPDPESLAPVPGTMVANWSQGNWSGSQDKRFRTLRAGLCLQESDAGRYLIYGYFSSATPSAMARVFLAYHCQYAMMLDMNALEHTYLAVYRVRNETFLTQHLIDEMSVLDKPEDGQELPRFVGFADNRDFFYLLRRSPQ